MKRLSQIKQLIKPLLKQVLFWPTSPFITRLFGEPFFRYNGRRQCSRDIDFSQVKRVLVVRLDQIGDVVMTTPFLRELRRNLPDAWITLVVLPTVFDLVENCPYVNEVLACDWEGDRDIHRFQRHWKALKLAQRHLWHRRFDLAILPRRDTDQSHGTFLAYFSGAPLRVGYSDNVFDVKPTYFRNNDCLLTHVINDRALKHEIEYNLKIIRFLGGKVRSDKMEIWLNHEEEVFAELVLKSHKVRPHELLVAFVPGAGQLKKIWPLDNFIQIGRWVKQEYHARILIIGGHGEAYSGHKLRQQLGDTVVNVVGQTTLRQTAALLKRCHIYVGNDTGAKHIAMAIGVPVVEISAHPLDGSAFNASSPARFGPWGVVPYRILQPEKATPPCANACISEEAHCITGVTVDQVKEAVAELLSNQRYPMLDENHFMKDRQESIVK